MDIHIVKTFRSAWIQRWNNGQLETALNGRELAAEAMQAIEPEVRQRWRAYWDSVAARAAVVRDAADVNEMTKTIPLPSDHYACPPALAAKAIWPTATSVPALLIEAGSMGASLSRQ